MQTLSCDFLSRDFSSVTFCPVTFCPTFVWESIHRHSPITFIFLFQARTLEEFEDTKGVIRIPKSKKKGQHYAQKIPKG